MIRATLRNNQSMVLTEANLHFAYTNKNMTDNANESTKFVK